MIENLSVERDAPHQPHFASHFSYGSQVTMMHLLEFRGLLRAFPRFKAPLLMITPLFMGESIRRLMKSRATILSDYARLLMHILGEESSI